MVVSATDFGLIDGGSGQDILKFEDGGSIDLTGVDNTRIQSIETLSMDNAETNTMTLGLEDVFSMSDVGNSVIQAGTGDTLPNSLVIEGDENDTLDFATEGNGSWDQL